MKGLQARAKDYARGVILRLRENILLHEDAIFDAIAEAYEQGYVDCGTEGEQPETQDEYFNDAPDCRYFSDGDCAKGLPGTPCERKGCAAYYPKDDNKELVAYLTRKNVETCEDARQLWRKEVNNVQNFEKHAIASIYDERKKER